MHCVNIVMLLIDMVQNALPVRKWHVVASILYAYVYAVFVTMHYLYFEGEVTYFFLEIEDWSACVWYMAMLLTILFFYAVFYGAYLLKCSLATYLRPLRVGEGSCDLDPWMNTASASLCSSEDSSGGSSQDIIVDAPLQDV